MHINKIIILLILLICLLLLFSSTFRSYYNENFDSPYIIGYIHVCQKDNWEKSFDMLMNSIKSSGLYEKTSEIRIGIVNEREELINDERLNDSKIKILFVKNSNLYERPTLLHMKEMSYNDPDNTIYYYLHTKGLKHFGTKSEENVLKWIKEMLYWNINKWESALQYLKLNETYGINYNNTHYSGNFWWSTIEHIKRLPNTIDDYYTAPEDWILKDKTGLYCAYNCEPHFDSSYIHGIY
jgi:hypothetical protein